MSDSWHSYPSIYNLGHKLVRDLFEEDVLVEEKVDGSQFSFGIFEDGLRFRSKGATIYAESPEKMFARAVEEVKQRATDLHPGWTYRAEYLQKPKHNALAYNRIPAHHFIIFDINTGEESYLSYEDKAAEAARLGLETVPRLYAGRIEDVDLFRKLLDTVSILGGQKIEGIVVKNYARFGPDKKALMGKYVSEAFKEVHLGGWRQANPNSGDIVTNLGASLRTPARWAKAVQHLREAGSLEDSPRDIGLLFREVPADIRKECESEIRDALFSWAWPKIQRIATAGLAEWYKDQLLQKQFNAEAQTESSG